MPDYYPEPVRQAMPAAPPLTGSVELSSDRPAIVYVADAYGRMVPMLKHHAPALPERTPPRDLTPGPLLDPIAQRLGCGGVLAAGIGWGGGQLLIGAGQLVSAVAAAGSVLLWVAVAVVAARVASGRGRTVINNTVHVRNEARWFGRTSTTAKQ